MNNVYVTHETAQFFINELERVYAEISDDNVPRGTRRRIKRIMQRAV